MILYQVEIKPKSAFGSPPISDTIFGNLVWSLVHLGCDVDSFLQDYLKNPFLVVSDFFVEDLGLAPKIPTKYSVGETKEDKLGIILGRKSSKAKSHIPINSLIEKRELSRKIVSEISSSISKKNYQTSEVVRCSINRLTGTTGGGPFSPYAMVEHFYRDIFFTFYFRCEEDFCETVLDALSLMGEIGFGKDATVGKGKFEVLRDSFKKIDLSFDNSYNGIYTLSNLYLYDIPAEKAYYEPFTRFGKHGDILATTGNPFKNPVVVARQGAILLNIPKELLEKGYVGTGIKGISYHDKTVYQGYSLFIPHKFYEEDVI